MMTSIHPTLVRSVAQAHQSSARIAPGAIHPALNVLDRMIAISLLVVVTPLIGIAAVIIYLLSGLPPVVLHRRVGQHGEPFDVIKLRTMWPDLPPGEGECAVFQGQVKPMVDPRVSSAFARFCRRYSIDELPQLIQVVSGHMSLVGPRPITRVEMDAYYGRAEAEATSVRPGLSGLWQVKGRGRLSYRQRRRLDLFLVRHYSAGLYLRVLAATARSVLSGRDAW